MHRYNPEGWWNRAVKNFTVECAAMPDGQTQVTIRTYPGGTVVDQYTAPDRSQADQRLRDMGYERVPSYVAFDIDEVS
jgi:hypothetical protein